MIPPRIVSSFQKGFALSSRILLKRNFAGVYWDQESHFLPTTGFPDGPLLVFSTHSSWWDAVFAAEVCLNQMKKRSLGPMEESMFQKHRSLRWVGVFGVKDGDGPEVEKILANEFQAHPNTCLYVNPQGQYWPNELSQPVFKTGASRWSRALGLQRVPMVAHIQHMSESKPLAFLRLGKPVEVDSQDLSADSERLRDALNDESRALLGRVWESTRGHSFSSTTRFTRLFE